MIDRPSADRSPSPAPDVSPGAPATGRAATRRWIATQSRLGRRVALPAIALQTLSVALAIAQAWCVAVLLADALGGVHARDVRVWLLAFAMLGLLRGLALMLAERRAAAAGRAGRRRLRGILLGGLLAQGPALLRGHASGELAALAVDRIEALDGLFARWVPAASLALLGPLLVLLAALAAQPYAALVLLIAGICVPFSQAVFGIGAARAAARQFVALSRLQARFLDRMRGVSTIVLAGRAADEARALGIAAAELRRRTLRVLRVAFLSSAALDLAMVAALVAIALHDGAALTRAGAAPATPLGVARSLFALLLVSEFFAPLRAFALAYQDRMHASAAAETLVGLPAPPDAVVLPEGGEHMPPAIRTVQAHGVTVAFEDVRFGWSAHRPPVLDGLSFRVPHGETLIVAGPSGAGKSTVIELLLGFIRPQSGRITLNGAPIESIVPEALARMTSWIGQGPVLFAGSLGDNIRFARPEASEAELEAAVRDSGLAEVVASLPRGLATPIGEGGFGLSGGQAQRVAIARAFLKNAPLLLLDEPTAHLDPVTEAHILRCLQRLAINRTVILVGHSQAVHAFSGRRIDLAPRTRPQVA
ncbi:ATP-binding cassette subfamily C protein CydD [Endobacter medicaginis]|uniref:ATP-binding cassette subfamily C protein CydD n=3 Tax=Endobacter medicaginis TaxID=1181271 RepID=A0A839V3N8_9PROT|nr:thiol reductant ABC exporter subunit CydD [Endobacter medicaginis]MBB3174192.1 ATP-binding cassette subfamily C protein CydD [Endobacter medicaginis]MCX5474237.1 thiol reductant ABC exporter subunit CydD [Endobacter medicaginis]